MADLCLGKRSEIFEVKWVPDNGKPLGGHRLITKAQIAIGDLVPVKKAAKTKTGRKGKRTGGRVVTSGRVSKTKVR